MEDDLQKKIEDDLKKIKNGRRPPKINGRRPQKIMKNNLFLFCFSIEDNLKTKSVLDSS